MAVKLLLFDSKPTGAAAKQATLRLQQDQARKPQSKPDQDSSHTRKIWNLTNMFQNAMPQTMGQPT